MSLPSTKSFTSAATCSSNSSDILNEVLAFPDPQSITSKTQRKKTALNSMAVCITDNAILNELKSKETEKVKAEEAKKARELERERKRQEKEKKMRNGGRSKTGSRKQPARKEKKVEGMLNRLTINAGGDCVCPKCGASEDVGGLWICCDG